MGSLSPWHWAILVLALVILFGSKRLPDATRNLGRSLRIFKTEMSDLKDGDKTDNAAPAQPTQYQQPAAPVELPPAQPHVSPVTDTTVSQPHTQPPA